MSTSPPSINLSSLRKRSSTSWGNSGRSNDSSVNYFDDDSKDSSATECTRQKKVVKVKSTRNTLKPTFLSSEEKHSTKGTLRDVLPDYKPDILNVNSSKPFQSVSWNNTSITAASGDTSSSLQFKENFYDVPCEQLARTLLGKILVRQLDNGQVLKGRIVETECYLGGDDQASHSFRGKLTERNAPMFMKPGTAYVYFTYGMYYCFNISSQGSGAAVLIRAVEPLEGLDVMALLRAAGAKNKKKQPQDGEAKQAKARLKKALKPHELCSGPSKLCIAMAIDRDSCNKQDLSCWPGLAVHRDPAQDHDVRGEHIVVTKRVGIESAGREWADKPLRFYILGNPAVSKRDRARETELQ